jgi:uncharacterized membrane protein
MTDFTLADAAAFLWFALCWAGYTACADHSPWRRHSISVAMNRERRGWMDQMMARELRMVDMQIVGNLMRSLGFFASTTILLVAGLIAVLGATEQAVETLTELPFAVPTTEAVWHVKVLLLIVIFVYAFFKFAWAFRLTNNCSILIGAAPAAPADPAVAALHAERAAAIIGLAAYHLNRGLRGYFFALAALAWFLHPALFAVGSTWVVLVLYRREFRSRALGAIRGAGGSRP